MAASKEEIIAVLREMALDVEIEAKRRQEELEAIRHQLETSLNTTQPNIRRTSTITDKERAEENEANKRIMLQMREQQLQKQQALSSEHPRTGRLSTAYYHNTKP